MFVVHFRLRRRVIAAFAAAVLLGITLALVLPGCQSRDDTPIPGGTEEQRQAYLTQLGWVVGGAPIETLDLQLPQTLEGDWADYAALQAQQGLPFGDHAGQAVRRYTYIVTNYPGIDRGVQVNLYVCGETLIGGDVISTGANGFRAGLAFPEAA